MLIFGIILITVSILSVILGIICAIKIHANFLSLSIFVILALPGAICIQEYKHPTPHEKDVMDGKATYVETKHITGNDTIITYKIEWKQ